jgi:hypothetical protein
VWLNVGAQYSLNTNLQANSNLSKYLSLCVLSPTPVNPTMNIVPPGVGPAQPANCSYQSFFSDASNDPFSERYATALSSYNANLDNANIASHIDMVTIFGHNI